MTRYEKLKEDFDSGMVELDKFIHFLTICPGDEEMLGRKYGEAISLGHEYRVQGCRVGCQRSDCAQCWLEEYNNS